MKKGSQKGLPSPNRTVKYSFRLTEEQDIVFRKLAEAAGCKDNRSKFIVGRLLDWTFKVTTRDAAADDFYARLNDYYYQFLRIGNNYNQVVKSFHTHFSEASAELRLAKLVGYTSQLRANAEKVLTLVREFEQRHDR